VESGFITNRRAKCKQKEVFYLQNRKPAPARFALFHYYWGIESTISSSPGVSGEAPLGAWPRRLAVPQAAAAAHRGQAAAHKTSAPRAVEATEECQAREST
jgi:hypothetical protein